MATAPTASLDPWGEALATLQQTVKKKDLADYQFLFASSGGGGAGTSGNPPASTPPDVYTDLSTAIGTATNQRDKCKQQESTIRLHFRGKKIYINVRNKLESIVVQLDNFSKIAAVPIKGATGVCPWIGVVWGCFTCVLKITINDLDVYSKLIDSLDRMARVLCRCREYEAMYLGTATASAPAAATVLSSGVRERLLEGLKGTYAAILVFSVKVGVFFRVTWFRRLIRGLAKTYDTEFKPMLDQVLARVEETGQELEVINAGAHDQTHRMLAANAQQSHHDHTRTHSQLVDISAATSVVHSHVLKIEEISARVEGSVEKGKQKSEADRKETHGRLEEIHEEISQGVTTSKSAMAQGFGEVKGLITEQQSSREKAEEQKQAREDMRYFEEIVGKCRVWLQPVSNDYERIRGARAHQSGTCEWLFDNEEYLKWMDKPRDGEALIRAKALIVFGNTRRGKVGTFSIFDLATKTENHKFCKSSTNRVIFLSSGWLIRVLYGFRSGTKPRLSAFSTFYLPAGTTVPRKSLSSCCEQGAHQAAYQPFT
ncbi:hypothetical protein DFH27DRAFT_283334 [Peziza echinospora]|nr:hypothetical protein DFH27DRAFT_283334 [Peziza echinospora]